LGFETAERFDTGVPVLRDRHFPPAPETKDS
jgi:hypothetical protein